MGDARFGLLFEGDDRASQAIDRLIQESRALDQEIRKLKQAGDSGFDTSTKLGQAYLRQKEIQASLRQETKALTDQQTTADGALKSITAALSGIPGPAGQAASQIDNLAASFSTVQASINPVLLAVAGLTVGLVAGAKAASDMSREVANYQDELDLVSNRLGITTREVGALRAAAAAQGRSFQEVERSLDFFVRKIGDAATGNADAQKSFLNAGIAIRDFSGAVRPTGDILEDVSTKLRETSDDAIRASLAFDLFGLRAARSMAVITSNLREMAKEAEARGVIFSPDIEARLRRVDQHFDSLALSTTGLKNSFQSLVAISFEPFLGALDKAVEKAAKFANSPGLRTVLSGVAALERGGRRIQTEYGRDETPEERAQSLGILGPAAPDEEQWALLNYYADRRAESEKKVAEQLEKQERSVRAQLQLIGPHFSEFNDFRFGVPDIDRFRMNPFEGQQSLDPMRGPVREEDFYGTIRGLKTPEIEFSEAEKATEAYAAALRDATGATTNAEKAVDQAKGLLQSTLSSFFSNAIHGFNNLGSAIQSMIQSLISAAASQAATGILGGLFETAARTVTNPLNIATSLQPGVSGPVFSPAGATPARSGSVNVHFYNYSTISDAQSLRVAVEEQLAPMVLRSVEQGSMRSL